MELAIAIGIVIGLWLLVVWGGFYILYFLKVAKPKTAAITIRVLYFVFFALAGPYILLLSPVSIRPSIGSTLFIVIFAVTALLLVAMLVSVVRIVAANRR